MCFARNSVHFLTSQLQKVLGRCGALCRLTSAGALSHNGVQFLISKLTDWRLAPHPRLGEPTFGPSQSHKSFERHSDPRVRAFSIFSPTCIFFLLTLLPTLSSDAFVWLFSSYSFFCLLLLARSAGALPSLLFCSVLFSSLPFCSLFWLFPPLLSDHSVGLLLLNFLVYSLKKTRRHTTA